MKPRPGAGLVRRALRNVLLACVSGLGAFALTASPGCGTAAQGVEDCRQIEQERCVAAKACGIVSNTIDCQIFYRDHCLHGFPTTPPPHADIDACVATITSLDSCVQSFGPHAKLASCGISASDATFACDVVQYPERADACAFLSDTPPSTATTSTGGQGGQGGSE